MVDLALSTRATDGKPVGGIFVSSKVWLVIAPSADVWQGDLPHLIRGLRRVAPRFMAALADDGRDLVFVLDHFWYPLTDSQDDAIELAVAGWAAAELDISDEPATVSFDHSANRYAIEHNEAIWDAEL